MKKITLTPILHTIMFIPFDIVIGVLLAMYPVSYQQMFISAAGSLAILTYVINKYFISSRSVHNRIMFRAGTLTTTILLSLLFFRSSFTIIISTILAVMFIFEWKFQFFSSFHHKT